MARRIGALTYNGTYVTPTFPHTTASGARDRTFKTQDSHSFNISSITNRQNCI